MTDWKAARYLAFEDQRTRPAADLLARIAAGRPERIADLGCGPGNSTALLARRFPEAQVTGVDSAPDMLAAARTRLPGIPFVQADIATWEPGEKLDIIFANAVLQWLPHHAALLARLTGLLAPGGWLAVQMPDNLGEPTHALMREVAQAGPWAGRLAGVARLPLLTAGEYYDVLRGCGADVDIWRTTYVHALDGPGAIVEWVRGTGLLPYLAPLDAGEREEFLARYRQAIGRAYPPQADGTVLLPFPRLFLVAHLR